MAQSMFPLVDRLLGGTLAERLQEKRDADLTYVEISRWLEDEHDITVTYETVRAWCKRAGVTDGATS